MLRAIRAVLPAALLIAVGVLGSAQPVAAGCSVNVKFVNRESTQSKVDEHESKSKAANPFFLMISTWKRLGDTTINVPANGEKTRTYKTDFSCSWPKRFKFLVKNGGSTKTIYKPSSTGWTSSQSLTVTIDF